MEHLEWPRRMFEKVAKTDQRDNHGHGAVERVYNGTGSGNW